jgi:5-methylcytosine-specific restriction protein A
VLGIPPEIPSCYPHCSANELSEEALGERDAERSGSCLADRCREQAEPPSTKIDAVLIQEWTEGGKRLAAHLRSERACGLPAAKKAQFIRLHGHLYCERCEQNPVDRYDPEVADACIEVHHHSVAVATMSEGHVSRLEDLKAYVRTVTVSPIGNAGSG